MKHGEYFCQAFFFHTVLQIKFFSPGSSESLLTALHLFIVAFRFKLAYNAAPVITHRNCPKFTLLFLHSKGPSDVIALAQLGQITGANEH